MTINDVLAEHHWAAEVQPPEGVDPYLWCVCGWRSDDATDASWRSGEHARLANAHVAAAVLDHLRAVAADEAVRAKVARTLCGFTETPKPGVTGDLTWQVWGEAMLDADAALTAFLGALGGEA